MVCLSDAVDYHWHPDPLCNCHVVTVSGGAVYNAMMVFHAQRGSQFFVRCEVSWEILSHIHRLMAGHVTTS